MIKNVPFFKKIPYNFLKVKIIRVESYISSRFSTKKTSCILMEYVVNSCPLKMNELEALKEEVAELQNALILLQREHAKLLARNQELQKSKSKLKKRKRNFLCQHCDKQYSSQYNLNRHLENYHKCHEKGNEKFLSGKHHKFRRINHQYECLKCCKNFELKRSLKRHMQKEHPDVNIEALDEHRGVNWEFQMDRLKDGTEYMVKRCILDPGVFTGSFCT